MSSGTSRSPSEKVRSRLTPFGRIVCLAAGSVFLAALTSGVNLLYLVDGMLWAVTAVAFFSGRARVRAVAVAARLPDSIFAGSPFVLDLRIRNDGRRPAFQVSILTSAAIRRIAVLDARAEASVSFPAMCPGRGRVRLNDLWIESGFPFGLFLHRRGVDPPEATVFPAVREITGPTASPLLREDVLLRPVRGVGDDFIGVREYTEDDDARLIHWTLSAKTGVPVLKHYARETGNRITVTVSATAGPEGETVIAEAASLAKYHIDEGAEVRLVTPEKTIDYGRGILQLGLVLGTLALLGDGATLKDAVPGASPFGQKAAPSTRLGLGAAAASTAAAFGSLFLIEDIPLGPMFIAAAVLLLGGLAARLRVRPAPKPLLEAGALLFLVYLFVFGLPRLGIVASVVQLISFILVYLVWGAKNPWTLGELMLAGFLAFLFASTQALSLVYFGFFAAYFVATAAWILRRQDPEGASGRPAWRKSLLWMMSAAAAVAVCAFIFWPRPFNPGLQRLLARSGFLRLQTGFRTFGGMTERVELGTWDSLRRNTAPAMRVSFEGGEAAARPSYIRVRGAAFDLFDGRRWRRTRPEFRFLSAGRSVRARYASAWFRRDRGRLVSPGYEDPPEAKTTAFFLYPVLNTTLVFSLGRVGAIESTMPGAYFDANDSVYFSTAYPDGLRYRIVSSPETPAFSRLIEDYDALLPRFLAVPSPDEAIGRLAAAITRGRSGALRRAEAIETHLRTAFTYSNAAGRGRQTLREFLFEGRSGNCEYFATAMCLLLRHLGIPSRLVVGFVSDAWNEYGDFFDVRQSDAHAWVEAYIEDRGWMTFDPTPSDSLGAGPPTFLGQLWSSGSRLFEALQFRWYRFVVGFDTFTQRDFWLGTAVRIGRILVPLLGGLGLLTILFLAVRSRRPGRRGRGPWFRRSAADGPYEDVLRRLSRAGLPRPLFQTGREYAAWIVEEHPPLSPLADLTELRYARIFAGRAAGPESERTERALAASVRLELPAVRRKLKRDRRAKKST